MTAPKTKKDAITKAPEHNLPSSLINSMEDLHIFSAAVYKSNMYAGIKNPETAMVRIQAGRELGLQPMMALNKIHVLPKGDIIIATQVLGAVAMAQGVRWQILQKDAKGCKLRIYMLDGSIPEYTESFMMEDAKRADLDQKDNYKMYPEEMCYNRCLSKGLRVFDPRIGSGFYTKEEMEDVDHFKPGKQEQAEEHIDLKGEDVQEDPEVVDAEVVDEEEDIEEAVEEAMEESEEQPQQRAKKPEQQAPEVDDSPKFTAEQKQKEEDIVEIKKHLEILKLDVPDFKKHLFAAQKTKKFVDENQHGHLSFHSGEADAIAFLRNNAQRFSRKYVEDRMKGMAPGEKIGCFIVPEKIDA